MPDEHAKYNPSSLKLWEICPSYRNRQDQEVHPVTAQGSRIHDALETGDPSKLQDDEEIELFEVTSDVVSNILFEHFGDKETWVKNEIRIKIELGEDSTFGTCDKLVLDNPVPEEADYGVALDYKMGYMEVDDCETNGQVSAYSAGIFQRFPNLKHLHFYLLIPRQDEISHAKFTREDGKNQALRVKTIIRRAKELEGKEFNPQINLCEFCGRQGSCNALAEKALLIARKYNEGDAFPLPESVHGSDQDDPEEVAKLLQITKVLEGWIKGVKARADELAFDDGFEIPGFKKVWQKTQRSVSDALAAFSLLDKNSPYNLTLEEFLECCSKVSIGKLEAVIKAKAPKGMKARMCEDATDLLRDHEVLTGGEDSRGHLRIDRNYKKEINK